MKYSELSFKEKISYYKKGYVDRGKILIYKKLPTIFERDYINGGENGSCFRIYNNYVFKYDPLLVYNKDFQMFTNFNNSSFALPKILVFEEKRFVGYIMDYIDGQMFSRGISHLNSELFLKELRKFEANLINLSSSQVLVNDIYGDNIMISKDGRIVAIDTDYYKIWPWKECILKNNLSEFSRELLSPIVILSNIVDRTHIFDKEELNNMGELTFNGICLASELFSRILYEIESKGGQTSTIKDVQLSMKLLLK